MEATARAAPVPVARSLLAGRRAVVTAAAGTGIGFATARRLRDEGAAVVISDRHAERLGECAEGLGVEAIACDVTDGAQVEALFADATGLRRGAADAKAERFWPPRTAEACACAGCGAALGWALADNPEEKVGPFYALLTSRLVKGEALEGGDDSGDEATNDAER